ncbi:MAG: hypothetical protein HC869_17095 [Rhodospirillales bacterium]|nr:hypothetical protein [Rhodospirillales bacterium]
MAVSVRAFAVARGASTIDIESIQVASDLHRNLTSESSVPRTAQHHRTPGHPLLLAVVAIVDPNVRQGLACSLADRRHCRSDLFATILALQVMAAVASCAMLLIIAWRLSGSWEVALIAVALTFIATRPGDLAGLVRPMIWYHFLLTLYVFLAVLARRSVALSLGAGTALGTSVLFEPVTVVLIPVTAMLFLLAGRGRSNGPSRQGLRAT